MRTTVHQLPSGRWFWMVDGGNALSTSNSGTTRTRRSAERQMKRLYKVLNTIAEEDAARHEFWGQPRRGEQTTPQLPTTNPSKGIRL